MASQDLLEEVHTKLTPITVLDVLEINEKYVDNDEIRSNGSTEIFDENESPEKNEVSTPIRKKKRALWSQVPHFAHFALQNKQTKVFSYSSVLEMIFEDTIIPINQIILHFYALPFYKSQNSLWWYNFMHTKDDLYLDFSKCHFSLGKKFWSDTKCTFTKHLD